MDLGQIIGQGPGHRAGFGPSGVLIDLTGLAEVFIGDHFLESGFRGRVQSFLFLPVLELFQVQLAGSTRALPPSVFGGFEKAADPELHPFGRGNRPRNQTRDRCQLQRTVMTDGRQLRFAFQRLEQQRLDLVLDNGDRVGIRRSISRVPVQQLRSFPPATPDVFHGFIQSVVAFVLRRSRKEHQVLPAGKEAVVRRDHIIESFAIFLVFFGLAYQDGHQALVGNGQSFPLECEPVEEGSVVFLQPLEAVFYLRCIAFVVRWVEKHIVGIFVGIDFDVVIRKGRGAFPEISGRIILRDLAIHVGFDFLVSDNDCVVRLQFG